MRSRIFTPGSTSCVNEAPGAMFVTCEPRGREPSVVGRVRAETTEPPEVLVVLGPEFAKIVVPDPPLGVELEPEADDAPVNDGVGERKGFG